MIFTFIDRPDVTPLRRFRRYCSALPFTPCHYRFSALFIDACHHTDTPMPFSPISLFAASLRFAKLTILRMQKQCKGASAERQSVQQKSAAVRAWRCAAVRQSACACTCAVRRVRAVPAQEAQSAKERYGVKMQRRIMSIYDVTHHCS